MQDVNLEQAIQYVLQFIGIFGVPQMFKDEEAEICIQDYRGLLPCGLIEINQVKKVSDNIPLRQMTATFNPGDTIYNEHKHEYSFKTQGRVIFTSFKDGDIKISYKSIPVDEEGLPMLLDNEKYLNALELFIKSKVFTVLFECSKISSQVLQHTEQEYSWAAGQLHSEFKMPSISQMESITRMMNQMIVRENEFFNNFDNLGDKQYLRKQ